MKANLSRQIKLYEDGTIITCPIHRKGKLPDTEKSKEIKKQLSERGHLKKSFSLESHTKRLIRCSAIRLWHTKI